jgi:hypothetical protein
MGNNFGLLCKTFPLLLGNATVSKDNFHKFIFVLTKTTLLVSLIQEPSILFPKGVMDGEAFKDCLSNSSASSKHDLISDLVSSSRLEALKDLQKRN